MVEIKYTVEPRQQNSSLVVSFDCPNLKLDNAYFKYDYGKIVEQTTSNFKKDIFIYYDFYNVAQFCFNLIKFEYPWDIKQSIRFVGPNINEYTSKFFSNEYIH